MGFFNKLSQGWREGRNEHLFKVNNKKLSYNLYQLSEKQVSYGKFISNTSYLFSEQLKYTIYPEMSDKELNRISIVLGFWLFLYCFVSKHHNFREINKEGSNQESFELFYNKYEDEFFHDFISNNPTVSDDVHIELKKLLDKHYHDYLNDQVHLNMNKYIQPPSIISNIVEKNLSDFLQDNLGLVMDRLKSDELNYLLSLFLQKINDSISIRNKVQ